MNTANTANTANAASYDFSRLVILVVEESALMRELIRDILREMNIREVTETAKPEMALDLLKKRLFDLVVINWSPVCDGLALLKEIRRDKNNPAQFVPVIVMSAYTELGQVAQARDAGANAFLAMPVTARDIYDHLAAVVEANRPFVRVEHYIGPDRRRKKKAAFQGENRRKPAQAA
ncbi:MAG: response regulator [Alphaproteobacteria bacterium]|nr:response regulator [Alphaproteobacteria bacterium]